MDERNGKGHTTRGRIGHRMWRFSIPVVAALVALLAVVAPSRGREPFENQWGPFTGTVVDASTGEPIPGAVFAVVWQDYSKLFLSAQFFDARVAVADEQGRFEVPRRTPPSFLLRGSAPSWMGPYFSCLSPGYKSYERKGAQNAPIPVQLQPLNAEEREGWSNFDKIPWHKAFEFEKPVNQKRAEMGLAPICISGSISWCQWATADSWFTGRFDRFPIDRFGGSEAMGLHQVNSARVFPVPNSTLEEAIALLDNQPVVALTDRQVAHLIPDSTRLDPDKMLQDAAAEAMRQAERLEKDARKDLDALTETMRKQEEHASTHPPARKQAELFRADVQRGQHSYLEGARISRGIAEHALSLSGQLKPYLVRGLSLNWGTGISGKFVLYLDGTELLVEHALKQCTGCRRVPMKRRPLVVFLERAPTKVEVTMNVSAE